MGVKGGRPCVGSADHTRFPNPSNGVALDVTTAAQVCVIDAEDGAVRLTVVMNAQAGVAGNRVQFNNFSPNKADAHWADIDTTTFASQAAGQANQKTALYDLGHKYYRFFAATAAGGGTADVSWTGA